MRALAADGQTTAMTETAVATEVHQALDVLLHLAPQVTFDLERLNRLAEGLDVRLRELVDLAIERDVDAFADDLGRVAADAVDVRQCVRNRLAAGEIDTCYARHEILSVLITFILPSSC